LKSTEETLAAAIKAQEQKLSSLRNEETNLTSASAELRALVGETEKASQAKTAALAQTAEAESRTAAAKEEFVRIQAELGGATGEFARKW
jgi:septal ring factor EnvC (AmiA/AmiB activator)